MAQVLGSVTSVAGARVTAKLDSEAMRAVEGAQVHTLVRINGRQADVFATIRELHVAGGSDIEQQVAELELMGERPHGKDGGPSGAFQRGVSHFPRLGDKVYLAVADDLREVYVPDGDKLVPVGTIDSDGLLPAAVLSDDLLGKHFAILGTTGSGKSCAVAVLLRGLLEGHPNGHVILLDPHNEYKAAFGDQAVLVSPETMSLPYWLLNFEEMVSLFCSPEPASRELEADILKRAVMAAKDAYLGEQPSQYPITVDTPVPFRLSTMLQYIDRAMGQINKPSDTLPYMRLKSRIETLRADRRFEFMFGGVAVQDTMANILSQLLRIPVAGQPITIVDLSAVPVEVVDSVVSLLCRLVFDFSIWTTEEQQCPVLLVCEEAHRYIPSDDAEGFGPTRKALSRIAKEGRKYGVALGLVTQRPSELSETILSQCGTLFALRMSNDRDQEFVRRSLPDGARALFNALPALGTREAIVVGEGAAVPMRIRFARLPYGQQPRAGTTSFAAAWQRDDPGPEILTDVIDRWRRQLREKHDDEPPRLAAR
ncbi:ATP-binding protein [Ferruginivarius sediminum]|uniref:DUF87 domain-containing protein n=1 Tax=Ferruginivarius sediminum TaxID=2661937 RepID=A0A369TD63_9PROT|nr:ATP-binding protein [Ferruginivarius sediminum]RDD60856.1 DUF87 domain-containing protein [Ferruginivarius sediminum]